MTAEWEVKPLGSLCDFVRGPFGGSLKKSCFKPSGYVVYEQQHAIYNQFDDVRYFIDEEKFQGMQRFELSSGDLIMSCSGTMGKVAIVPEDIAPGIINQALLKLTPTKSISAEFLKFWMESPNFQEELAKLSQGVAIKNVASVKVLKEIQIPLPPLPEQKRIVAILDEAFAGIATAVANTEKNLGNARELFEGYLQFVLLSKKWQWKTLGDLCDGVEYGSSAKSKKEGKVPVLRMGNIQKGQLDWENLVYTDDKDEIKKYLLKHNDVLFNRTNSPELVGKTAIYKSEMPAIFAGYLIRIRRKEDLLDADYLNYFLNSQVAFDYGKTVVISSVNQANINGSKLKGYPIPAPSISEQRIIVQKLDGLQEETNRLQTLYQHKRTTLAELKQSLLHKAFSGALTSQSVSALQEAVA